MNAFESGQRREFLTLEEAPWILDEQPVDLLVGDARLSELRAMINYVIAIAEFELVQYVGR